VLRQVHLSHTLSLKGPESSPSKVIPLVPFNVVGPIVIIFVYPSYNDG
jgi:hypothetical protein